MIEIGNGAGLVRTDSAVYFRKRPAFDIRTCFHWIKIYFGFIEGYRHCVGGQCLSTAV